MLLVATSCVSDKEERSNTDTDNLTEDHTALTIAQKEQ